MYNCVLMLILSVSEFCHDYLTFAENIVLKSNQDLVRYFNFYKTVCVCHKGVGSSGMGWYANI